MMIQITICDAKPPMPPGHGYETNDDATPDPMDMVDDATELAPSQDLAPQRTSHLRDLKPVMKMAPARKL